MLKAAHPVNIPIWNPKVGYFHIRPRHFFPFSVLSCDSLFMLLRSLCTYLPSTVSSFGLRVFDIDLSFIALPMAPTPVLLPGKSHGQRSLVGYSPRGHKEPDTTEHT